jgi:hypothetical protein
VHVHCVADAGGREGDVISEGTRVDQPHPKVAHC